MKKTYLILGLSILIFACRKQEHISNHGCNNITADITGSWTLTATRIYSIPGNPDPNWQPVITGNPVIIKFLPDSVFSYDSSYNWKFENYNRFTETDSVDFRIYSTNPSVGGDFPHYPSVAVKMISENEIELTYMGVDTGEQEKYAYTCRD